MKEYKNVALWVVGIVLAVALIISVNRPVNVNVQLPESNQTLGSVTGPESLNSFSTVNGVPLYFRHSGLNQASTTVCALPVPTEGTSTLLMFSLSISTPTTTTIVFDLARSTSFSASTTLLGATQTVAGTKAELFASSTIYAGLNTNTVFGKRTSSTSPYTYLTAKYGGGGISYSTNVLQGSCNAVFIGN